MNQKTNFYETQKDCHQDNLSSVCLQFYKYNCLNIVVGNVCSHKQVKHKLEVIVKDSHSTPSSCTFKPRKLI